MGLLKTRVKRLEAKLLGENGIPKWAMDMAEQAAYSERHITLPSEALLKATGGIDGLGSSPKPPPQKFKTKEDIVDYAKQLDEKYASLEDYKQDQPPNRQTKASERLLKLVGSIRDKE